MVYFIPKGRVLLADAAFRIAEAGPDWLTDDMPDEERQIWARIQTGALNPQGLVMTPTRTPAHFSRMLLFDDVCRDLRRELHAGTLTASSCVEGRFVDHDASFWGRDDGDLPFGDNQIAMGAAVFHDGTLIVSEDLRPFRLPVLLQEVDVARLESLARSSRKGEQVASLESVGSPAATLVKERAQPKTLAARDALRELEKSGEPIAEARRGRLYGKVLTWCKENHRPQPSERTFWDALRAHVQSGSLQ